MHSVIGIGAAAVLVMSLAACNSSGPMPGDSAALSSAGRTCIRTIDIKKQTILTDQDIQFEMNNGDIWVNHLPNRCSGLKSQGGFSWNVHNATVCSNQEIIHVLDNGPSCSIGAFAKVQQPAG